MNFLIKKIKQYKLTIRKNIVKIVIFFKKVLKDYFQIKNIF